MVPHQDDDAGIAGNSIQNFIHSGAQVFAAFSTNGDNKFSADIRLNEAISSLASLGVDKAHIIFMGYGDGFSVKEHEHIFYAGGSKPITSNSGHTQTYGAAGLDDFAYSFRGQHSPYTYAAYLQDLKDLILYVHADIIIAVDFDNHPDHRTLSLSLDKIMGQILARPDNDYKPDVFKTFSYSLSFMAVPDFFADNLLETKKPARSEHEKNIIDTSCYSWAGRVRIPASPKCRTALLAGNIIAEALSRHVSQGSILQAGRIINSDEVFFLRRTDSLTYSAQVTSSSGDAGKVNDFMLLNTSDIESDDPAWQDYLWVPDSDDPVKELVFRWDKGQDISRVVLWGNVDGTPLQCVRLKIGEYDAEAGPLPEHGLPMVIDIPPQSGIREAVITVTVQGSERAGLAEVEMFEHPVQSGIIQPFIQITSDDNFIYEYLRRPGESSIPVECYMYKVNGPVSWEVEGAAHLEGNMLVFDGDGVVVLRASAGEVYCQAVIRQASVKELRALHSKQSGEQRYVCRKRFAFRVGRYTLMIREKGISATAMHILKRLISLIKNLGGARK